MDVFQEFFVAYQDHAAPKLDVYEQAIYLYIARHTIAKNTREATIGFKSARKKLAFGTGKAGTPPSEGVVYEKLQGLYRKGFIELLSSERTGTRLRIITPFEIEGLVVSNVILEQVSLDEADFFDNVTHRKLILERDSYKCFYCLRILDDNNYVIEHVVSRPEGTNSYKNLVSSCRQCNNRKGAIQAEDFLRLLYREGLVNGDELTERVDQLERLRLGEIKPQWPKFA